MLKKRELKRNLEKERTYGRKYNGFSELPDKYRQNTRRKLIQFYLKTDIDDSCRSKTQTI